MNSSKPYSDSLLSTFCVVSCIVIAFKTLNTPGNSNVFLHLIWTWAISTSLNVFVGIGLHFYGLLKKRMIRHRFVYNLFGTLNIVLGLLGLIIIGLFERVNPDIAVRQTPYLVAASLTLGILMYRNIYTRR